MLDRARHWFDQLRNAKPEAGHTAGAVHLSDDEPGRDVRIGAMGAFVFFGLFLGWAALAPLDAAVHAPGTVVVADSRRMVQTQDGGTIDRIHVREGDHVLAGDVLVEMRATEARAERDGLRAQWVELTALRARLLAEETGQRQVPMPPEWHTGLSEAERVDAQPVLQRQQAEMDARRRFLSTQQGILGSRRGQLNAQIGGFGSQRQAYIRQRELLQDELAAVQHLYDRGLAPLSRVRSLERAMAQIEVDLAGLRSSEARAREAIGEATLQGLSLEDQERVRRSEDLRRTDQLLADVAPGLEAARARYERALIRASASGTVVGLIGLTEGAVAPAGGRLMEIVPADDELVIDAQVAPQHADDVAAGMAAEIRFPGLTGRAMPILSGTVETVSADRLLDERSGIPYFTVRVRVDEASLAALNSNHPRGLEALGPGLPAEVLITLRPRTALQYLLEPLDQTLWRSFREA
jgi:HlyD family secretion protein